MAKAKSTNAKIVEDSSSTFPIPLSLDEFQASVLEVFYLQMRTICWMAGDKAALRIVDAELAPDASLDDLLNPDSTASDIGLTYSHIRHTPFANLLEHMYQYAYHGRLDASAEVMEDESAFSWIAAIVIDASRGAVAYEWDARTDDISKHTSNCVKVVELANARVMLEGGEAFTWLYHPTSASNDAVGVGSLTIRQMALLAGMEEMSIRAAANPKRANPLKTENEHGSTRVDPEVAKAWLQLKGRYVPIVREWSQSQFDLVNQRFKNFADLANALDARYNEIATRGDTEQLRQLLNDLAINTDYNTVGNAFLLITPAHLEDESMLRGLATALELPADLLVLRAKQLLAQMQLAQIDKQLKDLADSASTPKHQ